MKKMILFIFVSILSYIIGFFTAVNAEEKNRIDSEIDTSQKHLAGVALANKEPKITCLRVNSFSKKWNIDKQETESDAIKLTTLPQIVKIEALSTRSLVLGINQKFLQDISFTFADNSLLLEEASAKKPFLPHEKGKTVKLSTNKVKPHEFLRASVPFSSKNSLLEQKQHNSTFLLKIKTFLKIFRLKQNLNFDILNQFTLPQQVIQTSGMAIASLVLGIVGWVFFAVPVFGIICHVLAIIFGAIGLGETSSGSSNRKGGRNLAIAGLVLGIIGLVFFLLFLSLLIALLS
ncbi:MAG: DUF4190 domain-containing protein [Bacteroidia bacterium]|nr:DUF4190 domain-containing protein [Bacteroidia bacterium]